MMPPRSILSAVDFSDASKASLHCAARLAARCAAGLHVVHVIDPLLAAAARMHHVGLVADTRGELDAFCRDAAPPPLVGPTLHVVIGSPAAAICETAAALGADLIVAGSRGLSGLNRLMMGTTVEHVIRRAHTSVLTVPGTCPADDAQDWRPVLVAIEDPKYGDSIVSAAAVLARRLEAPLHLVHVVPPLGVLARWKAEAEAVLQTRTGNAQRELAAMVRRIDGVNPSKVRVRWQAA